MEFFVHVTIGALDSSQHLLRIAWSKELERFSDICSVNRFVQIDFIRGGPSNFAEDLHPDPYFVKPPRREKT